MENIVFPYRFENLKKLTRDIIWFSQISAMILLTPFALLMIFSYLFVAWIGEAYITTKLIATKGFKESRAIRQTRIKELLRQ